METPPARGARPIVGVYTNHHNHPAGSAISLDDIEILTNWGVSHMVPHGHDGATTWFSPGTKLLRRAARTFSNIRDNIKVHAKTMARTKKLMQWPVDKGQISVDQDHQFFSM